MKTIICSFIVLGYCLQAIAQNPIPNPGFEEWDSIPGLRPFWEPKSYVSKNRAFQTSNRIYAFRSTDSHTGQFSLLLTPAIDSSISFGHNSWLILDTTQNPIVTINSTGGYRGTLLPLPGFPQRITGWYKYIPDTTTPWPRQRHPRILFNGVQTGNLPGVCGAALKVFSEPQNEWTFFSADFDDECPPLRPSKFWIIIDFSSHNRIQEPSGKLWLDDLNLEYLPTSVAESGQIESFNIYPNPGKDFINIHSPDLPIEVVKLVDVFGKIVTFQDKGLDKIDVHLVPTGIYTVHCLSKGIWYTKKWIKN